MHVLVVCSYKMSVRKHRDVHPSHLRSKIATDLLCKVTAYHWNTQVFSIKEECILSCIIYVNISKARAPCRVALKIQN